jgi:putative heme-binding domain-containing protein
VYVADWHDPRTAHPDPDAEWDRSNGRIYRISHGVAPKISDFDLNKKSTAELLKLLDHPNDWYARTARRVLADRRDPEAILPLRTKIRSTTDDSVQQSTWALYVSGGFDESFGSELLGHRNEHVRSWTVRFLGDELRIGNETACLLVELAAKEPSPTARSQLACSARRLPSTQAIPIVQALCGRDENLNDQHIPLLLWWAAERHAVESREVIVRAFTSPKAWTSKTNREILIPRLVRRYAAEGTIAGDESCRRLIQFVPDVDRASLWQPLDDGLNERPAKSEIDDKLTAFVREHAAHHPDDFRLSSLAARFGDQDATNRLLRWGIDRKRTVEDRATSIRTYGKFASKDGASELFKLAVSNEAELVRMAALDGWAKWGTDEYAKLLVGHYPRTAPAFRARLRSIFLSRKSWAEILIGAVESKRIPAEDFIPQELFHVAAFEDNDLNARVRKLWGNLRSATPEEKLAEVRRFNNDLRATAGDSKTGRVLYTKHCSACHKLQDEGGAIGPDLTHANRSDRDYLLVSLVDPNSVIRREYMSYIVETKSNRLITGVITKDEAGTLTIANAKAEITTVQRDDIVSIRESAVSLMPEGLLNALKPQELRDLFAYLQMPKAKP